MKDHPIVKTTLILALVFICTGCAAGISSQSRSQVTYHDSFSSFHSQSKELIGTVVLFGGRIIHTQNQNNATLLTILHLPLNQWDRPLDNDQSQGRFLVSNDQFLDPAVYAKGYLVTVVGALIETREQPIDEMPYRYPVIKAQEIKLWQPGETVAPRFRFGFGIGASF